MKIETKIETKKCADKITVFKDGKEIGCRFVNKGDGEKEKQWAINDVLNPPKSIDIKI